jgi:hypothetical protein
LIQEQNVISFHVTIKEKIKYFWRIVIYLLYFRTLQCSYVIMKYRCQGKLASLKRMEMLESREETLSKRYSKRWECPLIALFYKSLFYIELNVFLIFHVLEIYLYECILTIYQ